MDEDYLRTLLRKYIAGAEYDLVWHRYLDVTWDVMDLDFVKQIDGIWAEYLNKFIDEDEFKSRLRSVL